MKHRRFIWQAVGLIVLLLGSASLLTLAFADEDHKSGHKMRPHSGMMSGHHMKGKGMMRPHMSLSPLGMKDELGLKDNQVKALEPVEKEYRKTLIRSGADIRVAMIDLGALLDQKSPDRGAISAKLDEISASQKQVMLYRVDTLLKLKDILTPAQYEQFRSRLKAQMERGMRRRMHGMGGMMGHGMMKEHGYGKGMMGGYGRGEEKEDDD